MDYLIRLTVLYVIVAALNALATWACIDACLEEEGRTGVARQPYYLGNALFGLPIAIYLVLGWTVIGGIGTPLPLELQDRGYWHILISGLTLGVPVSLLTTYLMHRGIKGGAAPDHEAAAATNQKGRPKAPKIIYTPPSKQMQAVCTV